MNSILNTIKLLLGYAPDYTAFDDEIIVYINSALRRINQLKVGKSNFCITGPDETWEDFIGANTRLYDMSKTLIFLKVKLMHDPPQNSFLVSNINDQIKELEWELNADAETFVDNEEDFYETI